MNILINGLGNIGTTLANICLDFKEILGIDKVYVYKNLPQPWLEQDIDLLNEKGASIVSPMNSPFDSISEQIDFVFECRDHDIVQKTPNIYQSFKRLKGVVAQGSEVDHGPPVMIGVNVDLAHNQSRVHVVSCNSHGIAAVMQVFGGSNLENLIDTDMVVVRRSEDLSASKKLVGSNVVIRHCDPENGTHHATDVKFLYQTKGIACRVSTSDINTPSQLMHVVRFNLQLKNALKFDDISSLIKCNSFCAATDKFNSNRIFELGRRYGVQGRIYSHAIICTSSIMLQGDRIKGWAFIPQEGNSILSTLGAYLWQTDHPERVKVMDFMKNKLLKPRW